MTVALALRAPANRHRLACVFAACCVVALGLASRKVPGLFPPVLGKYPGDALWALMVFFIWAAVFPRASSMRIAAYALATSTLVEFSQLYQAPWINDVRRTTLGHLVLGSAFSWIDLVAYAVGVAFGSAVDLMFARRST